MLQTPTHYRLVEAVCVSHGSGIPHIAQHSHIIEMGRGKTNFHENLTVRYLRLRMPVFKRT